MRRLLLLSFGLLLFPLSSRAQSVDASIGYSYFRLGGSGGLNQNGVSGSLAYNPNKWLGIVGDFGGYYASPGGVSFNTYTISSAHAFPCAIPPNSVPLRNSCLAGRV